MTDLRTIERDSIRAFVQSAADEGYLSGRVLDYGCGKQPYRDIVEAAGGEYHGYDDPEFAGSVVTSHVGERDPLYLPQHYWNAILCTQVLQYDRNPGGLLSTMFEDGFLQGGHLVLTYPTNWPEVEPEDLHRFTKAGMTRLLIDAGFEIVVHEVRAWFDPWGGFISPGMPPRVTPPDAMAFGYGVIARA